MTQDATEPGLAFRPAPGHERGHERAHGGRGAESYRRAAEAFLRREEGAVTIDWVVLTAGMVFFGAVTGFLVLSEVPDLSARVGAAMASMPVGPE